MALGFAVKPIFGNMNGYYCLDMTRETDRLCLAQLLEKSRTVNEFKSQSCKFGPGILGDTSQRGNWSCFRNEHFNKKPIEITLENFTPMPNVGKLEFDFSMIMRPEGDDEDLTPISDEKFIRMLFNFKIINEFDIHDSIMKLNEIKRNLDATNNFLVKSQYETPKEKAFEISLAMESFYENLPLRASEFNVSKELERIRIATNKNKKVKKSKKSDKKKPNMDTVPENPNSSSVAILATPPPTLSPKSPSKSRDRLSNAKELDASLSNELELSENKEDLSTLNMISEVLLLLLLLLLLNYFYFFT